MQFLFLLCLSEGIRGVAGLCGTVLLILSCPGIGLHKSVKIWKDIQEFETPSVHEEVLSLHKKLLRCIKKLLRGIKKHLWGIKKLLRCIKKLLRCIKKLLRCIRSSFGASRSSFGASEMVSEEYFCLL